MDFLDEIDQHIRQGRLSAARMRIRAVGTKTLKRNARLKLAQLSRRAGLPSLSLRLLAPFVRPKRILLEPASQAEKAEYAAALIDVGAVNEGLKLLESIDTKKETQALLF